MSGPTTKQLAPPFIGSDEGQGAGASSAPAAPTNAVPADHLCRFELSIALNAAGETAYSWDIAAGRLRWASNAPMFLGVPSLDTISTEARYRSLIAPEDVCRRAAVGRPGKHVASGVPYKVRYRLTPRGSNGDAALWVEDKGCLWAGADGQPACAAGVIRAIVDREVDQPLRYRSGHDALAELRRISLAKDVVAALEAGRMRLALQPIISTATWKPALYECLLRMELADGTTVAAGEFIGITEQVGLSRLIDRRALELAVELLQRQPDLHLSLNVSGLNCCDGAWLVDLHRLTAGGRLAERLTIEITETAAIQDLDQSVAFVDTLKELGCRVAVDDFGAGYTSFKNLKHLAVDMVKIDGAFVKNLARDKSDQVFIKVMADLARNLGMESVAEWVGDDTTARLLADAGIDYLQGFHFGEPVIADRTASGE